MFLKIKRKDIYKVFKKASNSEWEKDKRNSKK